jgi:seryl-tRNA synthetase
MLTLKIIREQPEFVIDRLAVKGFDAVKVLDKVLELDDARKRAQTALDSNLAQQNLIAAQIGIMVKAGKRDEADAAKQQVAQLKNSSGSLEEAKNAAEHALNEALTLLPNLPHDSVPQGNSPADNKIERTGGSMPKLDAAALAHWDLAKKYDIIDFEAGSKLTGAGFPVYKGKGASMQRALVSFFLAENIAAGYMEVQPPFVVNAASGFGTGQLPDKEGQMYCTQDGFYLIPTAEVPVTNLYRDTILNAADLPIKLTAYTPCFRREAGSYGKEVRGLNRLHQFDKVEIVRFEEPQNSYEALDEMVAHVESMVKKLELPYRIVRLCGGDMSFTSALTFDFEVYSAAQKQWLEVSSVSNFENYQANRLKCRFRSDKRMELVHTLNGSALALPRIVAALLENNQTPQGIRMPAALTSFTNYQYI